jgi:hypothetical protein
VLIVVLRLVWVFVVWRFVVMLLRMGMMGVVEWGGVVVGVRNLWESV